MALAGIRIRRISGYRNQGDVIEGVDAADVGMHGSVDAVNHLRGAGGRGRLDQALQLGLTVEFAVRIAGVGYAVGKS